MRDASTLLWQAIVFQLIALSYLLISQDLASFPYLRGAAVAALLLVCLGMLLAHRLLIVAAAGATALGAALSLVGGILAVYDLVFVVSPARIGMLGLILAYLVGGLLGYAAHAALAAGRALWRFRAINPYIPQVGTASPPATHSSMAELSEVVRGNDSRHEETAGAPDAAASAAERVDGGVPERAGDPERRVLVAGEA
jgi:hypothetical protein